jgi:RNA polymerase sigma factor (sigma-70 family)
MLVPELSTKEQLDEQLLLEEMIHGDYKVFTTLYETHVVQLTSYAFKFTADIQIIEDSIHDIFVWLWNHRSQLEITHSIKAYLFKCVRTSILHKVKKQKKVVFFDEADDNNVFAFFNNGEAKSHDTETHFTLKERLCGVLGLLTCKQKEVIYLRFYQGLSFDEIADNMELSTKACYKLMGRAIAELRKTCLPSWYSYIYYFLFFFNFVG